MKFSNLILLVGTIGVSKALDKNETMISTSGGIRKANESETRIVNMLPSLVVDSTNLCISTLTLSTCACESMESQSISTPGESPKYEGDEWDRYAETSKVVSTTMSPDYVLRTNFSTSKRGHEGSLHKNSGMSSVSITHSKLLENKTMTVTSSEYEILSLTFPSIYISSTNGQLYNSLTSVHHNVNFNTGYRNSSISTSYKNISSTIHDVSLSTSIRTSKQTSIDETNNTNSNKTITTIADSDTPRSQTQILHHTTGTTLDLITNTAKPEHSTTEKTKYAANEETEDHRTFLNTSRESSIHMITTSMQTKITMEPYPSTSSQRPKTSHTNYIKKPTILPEDNWSDYWSDENWSEEWPSEFWSEVFKETSKTDKQTDWKIHSTVEKHPISTSIKTNTNTGKNNLSELRSASKLQGIVRSTHASEGSFTILPTSHTPKQTSSSSENVSHEHQTEGHPTEEHHTDQTEEHQTKAHLTKVHHTKEHNKKVHNTKVRYTKVHQTTQSSPAESTFSRSESHGHRYNSENLTQTTANSNIETPTSSTSKNNYKPTTIRSKSNTPKISHTEYNSYTTEEGSTGIPIITPSISSSISPNLSSHSTGRYHSGSSYSPKTSYSSKRSRLSTTASLSPKLTSSLPILSRNYPRKLSYSPIFTLKPAPSQLSLGNARQVKSSSQPITDQTETETESIYVTLLSSTEISNSMILSSYLMQSSSNESSTVSTNENMSSTLARPWQILRQEEEYNEHESNASSLSIYYLLLAPCFAFIVLL